MFHKGLLITFEGIDGSGKSSVSKLIYEQLKSKYIDCVITREPGGHNNWLSESIRKIVLDINNDLSPRTEALLFAASRSQHVYDFILPKLAENKIILCDRFIDSSLVYQGYARELGIDEVLDINNFATHNTMPSLTFFLKIDPIIAMDRMRNRANEVDRFENKDLNFFQKIDDGYKIIADKFKDRYVIIDANQKINKIVNEILLVIQQKFRLW